MSNQALLQIIHNEPSFVFGTSGTRICLTRQAGMMGPVTFFADSKQPVKPYFLAQWHDEGFPPEMPSLLAVLRGDFFCAPFGGNATPHDGVQYPPHGETANGRWEARELREANGGTALMLEQQQHLRPGLVRKQIATLPGQSVIYQRHDLIGMSGPMCLGHHPNLHLPDGVEPGHLSFSEHVHAQAYHSIIESPATGTYSSLKPGAAFDDLHKVPLLNGGTTDLTRYPNRRGFEDIAIICTRADLELGWSAFSAPALGYAWFSLKRPSVLASTLLWFSNGGRHFPPWNGRNTNTIGIEDVTSFFHEGLATSAEENELTRRGIRTSVELDPTTPFMVTHIQGVARIGATFGAVTRIEPVNKGSIEITGEDGTRVKVEVEHEFLSNGCIKELVH